MTSRMMNYLFLVIFLLMALVSLYFLLARPAHEICTPLGDSLNVRSAITIQGLGEIGHVWTRYPDYMAGFSILAGLGFAGFIICGYNLSMEGKQSG